MTRAVEVDREQLEVLLGLLADYPGSAGLTQGSEGVPGKPAPLCVPKSTVDNPASIPFN